MTEAEIRQLEAAWHKATADPRALRRNHRENLRRNLTRKARFALWRQRMANSALIWLTRTPRGSAVAAWLWRL